MKAGVRRRIGVATGLFLGAIAIAGLSAPGCEHLHARGPMNAGHADVACASCHREAPGTLRQQLQSATRAWLHDAPVDVGFQRVTTRECIACHDRPDDRHPVARFIEPRFAEARAAIAPHVCESCHREHGGTRVTAAEMTYCRHCHSELAVDSDPLDVPHAQLVKDARWETCLGCHDYHGNHKSNPPRSVDDAIPVEKIRGYLDGGPSPYGAPVHRAATPGARKL